MSEWLKKEIWNINKQTMKMEDWLINNECTYEVMQEDATHGSERQSGDLLGDIFLFYTLQIRANKYFTEIQWNLY